MVADAKHQGYARDVSPVEAWDGLQASPAASLVDVRTAAEWSFVGLPDLSSLGRKLHCLEWVAFPSMEPNPAFLDQARAALGPDTEVPVYFLCRSGGRSRAAATALAAAGYRNCFNVVGGFEGDLGPDRRRGKVNGWKAAGLPWQQS
jgi:rhodanese-related sulfurtransferase